MFMVHLTIAIPCYNGENRLPQVLDRLSICNQCLKIEKINIDNFIWEIIVVDNNSTDQTASVIRHYQTNQLANIKYYFEPRQGAAFARQKAVEEARGELIGFLDDDNLPASDWLIQAITFANHYPQAGAFGGQIKGLFEVEPQFEIQKIACFLAIIDRGDEAFCYQPSQKILPPTAGLFVRRKAWLESVPKTLVLNYRGREAGLASEDLEAVLHIQQAGWEIWYNPDMLVEHYIRAWRLEKDYLVSVVRCIGLSRHHLRMMRLSNWQKPLLLPLYWFNDLRKLIQHQLKYGNQKLNGDEVLACEREWLRTSLISPWFLWRRRHDSEN